MSSDAKRFICAVFLSLAFAAPALCQSRALQEETAACQNDALHLCGPVIPDHAKIHACLVTYKAYLSAPCRAIIAPGHRRPHRKAH